MSKSLRRKIEMNSSETLGKLAEALAKAQTAMKAAEFDGKNPHFKSRYATLAAIMEACRYQLAINGIAIVQGTSFADGKACVSTRLIHSSGEWIEDTLAIMPTKNDPQGIGSALTYARRYSLSALVGIVADDDDDANAASQPPKPMQHNIPMKSVANPEYPPMNTAPAPQQKPEIDLRPLAATRKMVHDTAPQTDGDIEPLPAADAIVSCPACGSKGHIFDEKKFKCSYGKGAKAGVLFAKCLLVHPDGKTCSRISQCKAGVLS